LLSGTEGSLLKIAHEAFAEQPLRWWQLLFAEVAILYQDQQFSLCSSVALSLLPAALCEDGRG